MEYTTIWQPLTMIFVSFSIGVFFGALWMFYAMYKTNKRTEKELNVKTEQLNQFLDKYKDDDYEAY